MSDATRQLEVIRPGSPSAKTFPRAGFPNHQDSSKEDPMVSPEHLVVESERAAPTAHDTRPRRWPLTLLALPAAVAIWSGWVGLGQMAGFGVVHPLPGIADGVELNTAITLPIGVEAYSAYALGTWLTSRPISRSARRFAAWSALAALGLGLSGQVVYHLLTSYGFNRAPIAVVVFVSCLPVLVLGAGASLHHLLGNTAEPALQSPTTPVRVEQDRAVSRPAGRRRKRTAPRRMLADYLDDARRQLGPDVEPTPSWCRQVTGCSAGTSVKVAAALRSELADGDVKRPESVA